MAFDERDYMKDSHTRSNEKNLDIYYNPKKFRQDPQLQHSTHQYDEIKGYVPYTSEKLFALVLICLALTWIAFAAWKIFHN